MNLKYLAYHTQCQLYIYKKPICALYSDVATHWIPLFAIIIQRKHRGDGIKKKKTKLNIEHGEKKISQSRPNDKFNSWSAVKLTII